MIVLFLLWFALSALIGCLGALAVGHLVPAVSALSLSLGLALAFYLSRSFKLELKERPLGFPVFILYAVIVAGIYFHSVLLFFQKGGNYWIQNSFNLGDMSFHWSVIRFLAKGGDFWPENPIYGGFRFRYPFGMDFFNAFFENLGVPMETHLPLVTLLALLVVLAALHFAGGPLLVLAVFFSGGFFNFSGLGLNSDYGQLQQSLDFKNIFQSIFLTQRGFLYAMPVGVLLYRALQKYFAGEWRPGWREKLTVGILWGGLGFFHLHTFFFVSLFFGVWILWKRELKGWLGPVLVAGLLGLPFVVNALWPEAGTNSLVHWNPRGWNRQEGVGYFTYWLVNLGPWILAVLLGLIYYGRQKKWDHFVPTALAFAFFILFSHLILAPWDWDNVKLLVWCYVFALMGLRDFLWYQRRPQMKVLVLLFLLPGFLLFVRSLPLFNHGIEWASEREVNKAAVVLQGRDVNQAVMISPTYNHPVMLLGFKLYMGYPGHVWSHGYNYGPREQLQNRIYQGELLAPGDLPKDQVVWIYSGPLEKRRENSSFPSKNLLKVIEALDHEMYTFE